MKIVSVKEQNEGYIVNDEMFVPKCDGNAEYELIKEYISKGGIIEPQYSIQELEIQKQQSINKLAREYLNSTDWYVIRYQENGTPIPANVKEKRENARLSIKE